MTEAQIRESIIDENLHLSEEALHTLVEMTVETIKKNPERYGMI